MTEKPWLTLVAGPEGGGKSTLTRAIAASGFDLGLYVNADDIAAEIIGQLQGARPAQATLDRAVANETAARRQYGLEGGRAFTVETVLASPADLAFIKLAKAHGYRTRLIFIGTGDAKLNAARVKRRVSEGGHDVPEKAIAAGHERAAEQLAPACLLTDDAYLFDNSGPTLRLVASIANKPGAKPGIRFAPPLPTWVMAFAQNVTALVKAAE